MYISTKKILLQREEVRRNYRPTYLILLPRERQRERERERERESKPFITMYESTKNIKIVYREE